MIERLTITREELIKAFELWGDGIVDENEGDFMDNYDESEEMSAIDKADLLIECLREVTQDEALVSTVFTISSN
jgi:hypothetical protein